MERLRVLVELPWLVVVCLSPRVRHACLRWRLRLHGVDGDGLPQIQELGCRREAERRQLGDSWRHPR